MQVKARNKSKYKISYDQNIQKKGPVKRQKKILALGKLQPVPIALNRFWSLCHFRLFWSKVGGKRLVGIDFDAPSNRRDV